MGEGKIIGLDVDGVLADFDGAFEKVFGHPARIHEDRLGSKVFWRDIKDVQPDFYRNLPVMPGAIALYDELRDLRPIILTGCPMGGWAEKQKVEWAAEHFPGAAIVTCMSKEKRSYCQPGDVLVDDMVKYAHLWVAAGGVFVHHQGNVMPTVAAVRQAFAVSETAASGWTHVSERKPKCNSKRDSLGAPVLVFSVGGNLDGRHVFEAYYGKRLTAEPNFYLFGAVLHDVSHWQPLPEAP